jgi:murein DD-endopeptidase MepM/ murein hydrolase activator NlpD
MNRRRPSRPTTLVLGGLVVALAGIASVAFVSGWAPTFTGLGAAAAPSSTSSTLLASPATSAATSPSVPASASLVPASPSPSVPSPSPGVRSAPTSALGFRPSATVVPIGFPLPASAKYRYGDGFRAPRVGRPYWYNQIRGVTRDGRLLRAHDGQDLQVRVGTPVLASFDGVIVDPTTIWRPWQPAIYGKVVVVQSTESTSLGYRSISAHLSRLAVAIGDVVRRGQVVGWTGQTGNAAGTVPHLHFELRAPFMIEFHYARIARRLDVFDPRPSLLAADPNR